MSENSNIGWTDHTFNPWIGCTKVSPGCTNCYAETRDQRHLIEKVDHWGKGAPRLRTSAANWRKPLAWNRTAICVRCEATNKEPWTTCGQCSKGRFARRPRVFCASMADWLDDEAPAEWLADLLKLIHATPNLDWQLLTKRPENFFVRVLEAGMLLMGYRDKQTEDVPSAFAEATDEVIESILGWSKGETFPGNVWVGVSVEDQKRANERISELSEIPAAIRFLSCEPLLGQIGLIGPYNGPQTYPLGMGIRWVIIGGESGPGFREMDVPGACDMAQQCGAHGVAVFMKQDSGMYPGKQGRIPNEWWKHEFPETDARLRQGYGVARPAGAGAEVAA